MSKPRMLIPVTLQFGIRYLLRSGLLERLKDIITPVIVIGWQDDDLWKEFEHLGSEVYLLPRAVYGKKYQSVRKKVDIYHKEKVNSVSTSIDRRRQQINWTMKKRLKESIKLVFFLMQLLVPGYSRKLFKHEQNLLELDTNIHAFKELINKIKPDIVFSLTPFHHQEELLLRAAKLQKLPMVTAIHSFDNLTTRGWIPIIFDAYFLWNQYNQTELLRIYPEVKQAQIFITGTPQFDFYYNPNFLWKEEMWRKNLEIPIDRPVILFAAGPESIAPHESHFLLQLDDAIENGEILGNPVVLFRRHPVDSMKRWGNVMRKTKHVIYDDSWLSHDPMYFNIHKEDLEKLASSLCFSVVHISTSSTMTVDGAIFDHPQVAPAYDDRPGQKYDNACKELYQREHYIPITNSGGLSIAYNRDDYISFVQAGLLNPLRQQDGRKKMVKEICTYTDGQCADRVADALKRFLVETSV